MRMTIKMSMDNAAFHEAPVVGHEAARILRELASKIETAEFTDTFDRNCRLRDINGNTVGDMTVTGR